MSGGSWGYLYRGDLTQFLGSNGYTLTLSSLKDAEAELRKQLQPEVAGEMSLIVAHVTLAAAKFQGLAPVLKALEWWDSGDWSKEDFLQACAEWVERKKAQRAQPPPEGP